MPAPSSSGPVAEEDAPQLQALADLLDTVNLPDDPAAIAGYHPRQPAQLRLRWMAARWSIPSMRSFTLVAVGRGEDGGSACSAPLRLFALPRHARGAALLPALGSRTTVGTASSSGTGRTRHLLKLGRDIEPWTELGGLVVHPAAPRARGSASCWSRRACLLCGDAPRAASARGCSPSCFLRAARTAATPSGTRRRALTGLTYYRADLLCRTDKEFIDAFFPHEEILVDLAAAAARELIGVEGPATTRCASCSSAPASSTSAPSIPSTPGPHDGAAVAEVAPITRKPPAGAPRPAAVGNAAST